MTVKLSGLIGRLLAGCCAAMVMAGCSAAAPERVQIAREVELPRAPYSDAIGQRTVSFVARDMETGATYILEGGAPDRRRTPWSSFKIPHLVLALETGAVESLDTVFAWDPARRPAADYWPQDWRQDQTLRSAFQVSAAWVFQDIAAGLDSQTYRDILTRWAYGGGEIADSSDTFWLDHTLAISPREQVTFLDALLSGALGISPQTLAALDEAAFAAAGDSGTLYGKTGAGPVRLGDFDGRFEGWYAGYVRRADQAPIVFALHVEGASFTAINSFRRAFAEQLIADIAR